MTSVPGREAPLRREEAVPENVMMQSLRREFCIHSPQALGRDESAALPCASMTSSTISSGPLTGALSPRHPVPKALSPRPQLPVPQAPVRGSNVDASNEEARQRWRRERVESLERKCQELEQQLGEAKEAEVLLRREMLTGQATEPEARCPPLAWGHEKARTQMWPETSQETLASHWVDEQRTPAEPQTQPNHALAREMSAHTAVHDAFGLPGLSGSSRRSGSAPGSARLLLSPVAEEPHREESDAGVSEESIETDVRLHVREEDSLTAQDDAFEMDKLVNMCERLRTEGVSLPKAEIDGLSSLVGRLSDLMERRRGSPRHSPRRPENCEVQETPSLDPHSDAVARRVAVPKLRGLPFSRPVPTVAERIEDQDSMPSPREAPVLR